MSRKILIVTDAWHPQVNGAVTVFDRVVKDMIALGHDVKVLSPTGPTMPMPSYPEIRLALRPMKLIKAAVRDWKPDAVHIATEGSLGVTMRLLARKWGWNYTTTYMTRYPQYSELRLGVSGAWLQSLLRWFHGRSAKVLVPAQSLADELIADGFKNVHVWGHGVDDQLFHPKNRRPLDQYKSPVMLYVGRLAVEKNIEAFLSLDLPGTKLVIGDGPQREELEAKYKDAVFLGTQKGPALAQYFASADVLAFPSLTDTFGLVSLEALASGTPVAAFRVPGPKDVIRDFRVGALTDDDLAGAIKEALGKDRNVCREYASRHSWMKQTELFLNYLVDLNGASFKDEKVDVSRAV